MRKWAGLLIWICMASQTWAAEQAAVLSVSGTGTVAVSPDMAVISFGVVHTAPTAGEAMALVSSDATALSNSLNALGIVARDIQTSQLSLNPVWDNRNNNLRRITGYEARNSVRVRVRDLDALGQVIDTVLRAGSNTFGGLSFQLQDRAEAESRARAAAVQDAMTKAAELSAAAGQTLGPVLTLSEGGNPSRPQPLGFTAARSADVPISAGELTITARVSMTFALLP